MTLGVTFHSLRLVMAGKILVTINLEGSLGSLLDIVVDSLEVSCIAGGR
jgi:hypothetical protein